MEIKIEPSVSQRISTKTKIIFNPFFKSERAQKEHLTLCLFNLAGDVYFLYLRVKTNPFKKIFKGCLFSNICLQSLQAIACKPAKGQNHIISICRKQSMISIARCAMCMGDCPFTGLILPGMILPSQGLAAYLIQFRPSHAASFCTLRSMEQTLKRRPCFFCCRLNRRHPTVPRGCTTWTVDFKCREVKTGFCRKRWMQTVSSGAGNLVKPLISLYGTERRECGNGLCSLTQK